VGGLPVDIKLKCPVLLTQDGEVQHVYATVHLRLKGPLNLGMDAVEEVEEGRDMVSVYGRHGVVCLAEPEEDDADGGEGVDVVWGGGSWMWRYHASASTSNSVIKALETGVLMGQPMAHPSVWA
jgi:hypothetical protein